MRVEAGGPERSGCRIGITAISKGCQRHTNCLAWSKRINVVAFASAGDICIALPAEEHRCTGIESTVNAHDTPITCLKFVSWYRRKTADVDYVVTGATNGSVRLWAVKRNGGTADVKLVDEIVNSPGCEAVRPVSYCAGAAISGAEQDTVIVAYAIPDGFLVAGQVSIDRDALNKVEKWSYSTISFEPALVVSIAVHIVSSENVLFVLGTTECTVEVLCAKSAHESPELKKSISLRGHSDWICSIDIQAYEDDILIASGGQDNVIRIWRFFARRAVRNCNEDEIQLKTIVLTSLNVTAVVLSITLQAVLSAHDDWIYSLEWHPNKLQLMSASNDKTVIIWEPSEIAAGLWLDKIRVGDVGGQAVGFFGACFSPLGTTVLAYSYFGGFFAWQLEQGGDGDDDTRWRSIPTFGGHSGPVKDISWDPTGSYLLSCSLDQTTRCYAPSRELGVICEVARPQLHGYDLNCITSISSFSSRFVSGADEKILRVFAVPRNFVQSLENISKYDSEKLFSNPAEIAEQNASVPALGLSNKSMEDAVSDGASLSFFSANGAGLPTEEYLMQSTLWPEVQKLYGHGFEVFSVASNHSGTLVASACKASRSESARIIIWDSEQWRRRCELEYHKLTVVQLAFSSNDSFLLSVSRDRTFAIFTQSSQDPFSWKIKVSSEQKYSKVHSRIIWCCTWSPDDNYFVTGARDKKLCLWQFDGKDIELVAEMKHAYAVTAVDFVSDILDGRYILAVGFENGEIEIENWELGDRIGKVGNLLKRWTAHSQAINRLRFRPKEGCWLDDHSSSHVWELASASNDNAVKVHQLIL